MNQFVLLIADEVERVSRSTTDNADTNVKAEERRETWRVAGIELVSAQSERHEEHQRSPTPVARLAGTSHIVKINWKKPGDKL